MFDEIMQNMEKELIQQRTKVNQAGQQRQIIGRRLEILEQNLAENKVVMMELCKLKILYAKWAISIELGPKWTGLTQRGWLYLLRELE